MKLFVALCVLSLFVFSSSETEGQQCRNGVCRQYVQITKPTVSRVSNGVVYRAKSMHAIIDGEAKEVKVLVPTSVHKYKLVEIKAKD